MSDEGLREMHREMHTETVTHPTGGGYVRYHPGLEEPKDDEQASIDAIAASLHRNNERMLKKNHRAIRDAHAKSHGILRGELTVHPDLPAELRQGMFATEATYPVIVRLSTTAGAIRSDQVRGVRGLAIKVIGVPGDKVLDDDDTHNQDFVFVNNKTFPTADAHEYRTKGMALAWTLAHLPDEALMAISALLRGAARILKPFGRSLPGAIVLFTRPVTNTLGETFYTAAPVRYGDYVAKLSVAPSSPSVTALTGKLVGRGPEAHTQAVVEFFRDNSAEYVVSAQLCTDTDAMPIEDATVEWPESLSKYWPVATITYPAQNAYSDARRYFGDEVLAFNSWRAIEAHRPLGSINRLKRRVYDASRDFRQTMNKVPDRREPADIGALPD